MDTNKNKVVKRVKKLLELADTKKNSNLEEAAAAAAKAQSLIEKYRIERTLLDGSDDGEIHWKALIDKGQPEIWKNFLAGILARYNGCFVVRSENYETDGQIHLVGEPNDTEIIQKIYSYLVYELNKLCITELLTYKTRFGFYPDKNYSKSFYLGAISKIDERLDQAKQAARKEEVERATSPAARKNLQSALSRIDNKTEKAKDWVKTHIDSAKIEGISPKNPDPKAFMKGTHAAENISLNSTKPELKREE